MVKDLIETEDPIEAPLTAPQLRRHRQPSRGRSRPGVFLNAAIPHTPYDDGIRSDYRPIVQIFIDTLMTFPGETWQRRWDASGVEDMPSLTWYDAFPGLNDVARELRTSPGVAVSIFIRLDALRPSAEFLNRVGRIRLNGFSPWSLEGFPTDAARDTLRAVLILQAATGKHLREITADDVVAFAAVARKPIRRGLADALEILKQLGIVPLALPPLRQLAKPPRPDAAAMVARNKIEPPAVAEMFARYLKSRAPGVDYPTLQAMSTELLRNFWMEIRSRNPEQADLRIAPDIAEWWKTESVGRLKNRYRTLFAVRAMYLDIAVWATHDAYWATWSTASIVTQIDTAGHQKHRRRVIAAHHQRVRKIAPSVPKLLAAIDADLEHQESLLLAATAAPLGERFEWAGRAYLRETGAGPGVSMTAVPILDLATDTRILQARIAERAFWSWAIVHVMHETGMRQEEVSELTATALFTYEASTGEKMLLLQVVPSKSDRERVLLVSPELAHVLARLRQRARGDERQVPLVIRYDSLEREFSPPLPFLFQWKDGDIRRGFSPAAFKNFVAYAVRAAGLDSPETRLTAHDFRRLFATDALRSGLPVHILAKVMGHLNISTTQGYAAVFDEDVARHFRQFVDRRRSLRPAEDYRDPSPTELEEFHAHFSKRKVELGSCSRGYGTPCIHEHACIRCPMLRPDPAQRHRLETILANLHERRAEAKRMGWLGELEGIEISIRAAEEKLGQMSQIVRLTLERRRPDGENPTP